MFSNNLSMVRKPLFVVICVSLLSTTSSSQAGMFDWCSGLTPKKALAGVGKMLTNRNFYLGVFATIGAWTVVKKAVDAFWYKPQLRASLDIMLKDKETTPKEQIKQDDSTSSSSSDSDSDDDNTSSDSSDDENSSDDNQNTIVNNANNLNNNNNNLIINNNNKKAWQKHKTIEHRNYIFDTWQKFDSNGKLIRVRAKVSNGVMSKEFTNTSWDEFFKENPYLNDCNIKSQLFPSNNSKTDMLKASLIGVGSIVAYKLLEQGADEEEYAKLIPR